MQLHLTSWLKRMVRKSAKPTEVQIVNLFIILQDWMDAPGIRGQLMSLTADTELLQELNALLLSLASDTKAVEPEKLAFQLYFILIGALNEEARNPGCNSMLHASEAASRLVAASIKSRFSSVPFVAFASFAIVGIIIGVMLIPKGEGVTVAPRNPENIRPVAIAHDAGPASPRPDRLLAIYQMHELLRTGQCSYPQALMLSAEQRAVFLEGVVNIDALNTDTSNLDVINQLYQKVNCSYAPAAMLL